MKNDLFKEFLKIVVCAPVCEVLAAYEELPKHDGKLGLQRSGLSIEIEKCFGEAFLIAGEREDLGDLFGRMLRDCGSYLATPKGVCCSSLDPIDIMCMSGNLVGLKSVIEAGQKLEYASAPMFHAACSGNIKMLEFLLQQLGSSPESHRVQTSFCRSTRDEAAPLSGAVASGHKEAVQYLLSKGAKINTLLNSHLIRLAAVEGHTEVLQILLEAGASTDQLHCAFTYDDIIVAGKVDSLKILINAGGEAAARAVRECLVGRASVGKEAVKVILPLFTETEVEEVLHEAISCNNASLVRSLLLLGVEINDSSICFRNYETRNLQEMIAVIVSCSKTPEEVLRRAVIKSFDIAIDEWWSVEDEGPSEEALQKTLRFIESLYK